MADGALYHEAVPATRTATDALREAIELLKGQRGRPAREAEAAVELLARVLQVADEKPVACASAFRAASWRLRDVVAMSPPHADPNGLARLEKQVRDAIDKADALTRRAVEAWEKGLPPLNEEPSNKVELALFRGLDLASMASCNDPKRAVRFVIWGSDPDAAERATDELLQRAITAWNPKRWDDLVKVVRAISGRVTSGDSLEKAYKRMRRRVRTSPPR